MDQLLNSNTLLCHELVGRTRELQELSKVLQRVITGQPHFILLAGEAGLGKTKLCRVFLERSQCYHPLILWGQAIPQDQTLPFGPFLDAFRHYFSTPAGIKLLSESLQFPPELVSLFSCSEQTVPDLAISSVRDQQVIFRHILQGLQTLAQAHQGPLVLLLEDLHWADATSLDLLAFLAQRFLVNTTHPEPSIPLLILGTYRTEVLIGPSFLKQVITHLQTQRLFSSLSLAPLTKFEHQQFVAQILKQPLSEQIANLLFSWDEGNPFFTEELVGAMVSTGQLQAQPNGWQMAFDDKPHLPSSLSSAIWDRFEHLPATDQEVLSYAAVIGRVFDFSLLATLCGLSEQDLVAVLRRAVQAQLISEIVPSSSSPWAINETVSYQFRHALIREAIYQQLLVPERRYAHHMVAKTLEQMAACSPKENWLMPSTLDRQHLIHLLVEHYWSAGMAECVHPYALQEAERARQALAFREERSYLNIAQAGLPEDSPQRLDLLQRLGMVSMILYDVADATHWFTLANTGYQHIGYHRQTLGALANLLRVNWFFAHHSIADLVAEVEAAVEADLASSDDSNRNVEILEVLSLLAMYWSVDCQCHRSTMWIERSMALHDTMTASKKIEAFQMSLLANGWTKSHQHSIAVANGIAEMRIALKTARQHSLPDVMIIGYMTLAMVLIFRGQSEEARQVSDEIADIQSCSGIPYSSFLVGWQHFFSGKHWEQAIEVLRRNIEHLGQCQTAYLAATARVGLAHLLLAHNELAEACMHLQIAQPVLESKNEYISVIPMWWGLAKLHSRQGNLSQAQQWYEHILKHWKTRDDRFIILPIMLDGIICYIDAGDLARARKWLAELQQVVHATENPVGLAALLEAQGRLEAKEGKLDAAIQALRQAVQIWCKLKRCYQHALASHHLAEVLLRWAKKQSRSRFQVQTAREEAETLLQQATVIYQYLHLSRELAAIQTLRSQTALVAQQKRRRTLKARTTKEGLTPREIQVLVHLAKGYSNKEIAGALSISVGTTEIHVTHILAKLNCQTRTQAATYAVTRGYHM